MELRDIRYFSVVAEHLNLSRAAEALNLSVPAMSKSLRRLEDSVGAKLVQRSQKGVTLTTVGSALLHRIGPLQGVLHDVRQEAANLADGRAGNICIGVSHVAAENLAADACVALANESQEITFQVWAHSTKSLANLLRKGEIDFYVASLQAFSPGEFARESLFDDQFIVYTSSSHRLAGRKRVTLDDLTGERWALTDTASSVQWQQLCREMENHGLPAPRLAMNTHSQAVRMSSVAYAGFLGLSSRRFMQQEARKYNLVELPVKEITHVRHMSIIYRKDGYLSPAARRLIEILKEQSRGSTASKRLQR